MLVPRLWVRATLLLWPVASVINGTRPCRWLTRLTLSAPVTAVVHAALQVDPTPQHPGGICAMCCPFWLFEDKGTVGTTGTARFGEEAAVTSRPRQRPPNLHGHRNFLTTAEVQVCRFQSRHQVPQALSCANLRGPIRDISPARRAQITCCYDWKHICLRKQLDSERTVCEDIGIEHGNKSV